MARIAAASKLLLLADAICKSGEPFRAPAEEVTGQAIQRLTPDYKAHRVVAVALSRVGSYNAEIGKDQAEGGTPGAFHWPGFQGIDLENVLTRGR